MSAVIKQRVGDHSANMTSPDRHCRLRLSRIRSLWTMQLPVLWSAEHLDGTAWAPYIRDVYGDLHHSDFPIDLRCFTFWWKRRLPAEAFAWFRSHYRPSLYNVSQGDILDIGWRGAAWQVYLWSHSDFGPHVHSGVRPVRDQGGLIKPSTDDEWIEIYHDVDDCAAAIKTPSEPLPQVGYWAFFAPGSGIFANVGKTLISGSRGYKAACELLTNTSARKFRPHHTCSVPGAYAHVPLRRAAVAAGYNTLQSCCGLRGGSGHTLFYEIMFMDASCPYANTSQGCADRGACPYGIQFSRGRGRKRPCECNRAVLNINCDGLQLKHSTPTGLKCGELWGKPHSPDCVSQLARSANIKGESALFGLRRTRAHGHAPRHGIGNMSQVGSSSRVQSQTFCTDS